MPKRRLRRHSVSQPLDPSYKIIPLTRNQNALVDASDFDWLDGWNWCALWSPKNETFYAVRTENMKMIYMHRVILECDDDQLADHQNHDTLDNRKKNLRKCDDSQNCQNSRPRAHTSLFRGVYWAKQRNKWVARIQTRGKQKHLGVFSSEQEAAKAYDGAAKILHGEFAFLNFSH
jgi:AP2 domain